jgi:hypothetical protein
VRWASFRGLEAGNDILGELEIPAKVDNDGDGLLQIALIAKLRAQTVQEKTLGFC